MSDTTGRETRKKPFRKKLRYLAAAVALFLTLATAALRFYSATPQAAAHLADLISTRLHRPVTIESLRISITGITLNGVAVANPPGFPSRSMLAVRTIVIVPEWAEVIRGRRSFTLISLSGPEISIDRDASGRWNLDQFRRQFAGGKPGPGLFLSRLAVIDGSISFNGRKIGPISLQLSNLDTKGATAADLSAGFDNPAGDRFTLEGKVRPGPSPSFDLRLAAPKIDLAAAQSLAGKKPPLPISGAGRLLATATLRNDLVTIAATFGFDKVPVPIGGSALTLSGSGAIRGSYDRKGDRAVIDRTDIFIDDLLRLRASASLDGVKRERAFSANADMERVDVARLGRLLPKHLRQRAAVGGYLEGKRIAVAGSAAQGITDMSGELTLGDGSLLLDNRPIARGVAAVVTVSTRESGFAAALELNRDTAAGEALLQRLNAGGTLLTDRRFKAVRVDIPNLAATIRGTEVTGRIGFAPGTTTPLTASLTLPSFPLARLNDPTQSGALLFEAGTAAAQFDISGRNAQQLRAAVGATLSGARGRAGNRRFALEEGKVNALLVREGTGVSGSGNARLSKASIGTRTFGGSLAFAVSDRTVTLEQSRFSTDTADLSIATMTVQIPDRQNSPEAARYPIIVDLAGGDIRTREAALTGLSGTVRAAYATGLNEKWLEGRVALSVGEALLRGNRLGAPTLAVDLARSGSTAIAGGTLLGGTVDGRLSFNPFAPGNKATGSFALKGAQLSEAAPFIPADAPLRPKRGVFDAAVAGRHSHGTEPEAEFTITAQELSLAAKTGKPLLDNGTAEISGSLSGNRLSLHKGVLGAGDGVSLEIQGEMSDLYSPNRQGGFRATLGTTDINLLLDRFANSLPRLLQEASASGSIAGNAELALKNGKPSVSGELLLNGVTLGVESQKLAITGIRGSIPLSFAPSAGHPRVPPHHPDITRSSFPEMTERLRNVPPQGHGISIDSIAFGPLRIGETTLKLKAHDGLTELTSLRSSLYDGDLLGTAYLFPTGGYSYGADLLIDGLSLAQLCNTFPKIRGYISGRVEGVLSLTGGSAGKEGLIGLMELWTRETKGEKMLVSREFLQKLADKKLSGFFFSDDRPYDRAEISASLEKGYLEFYDFAITHTNFFGVRDLSVTVAESHNRIALEHLFTSIRNAAVRGKGTAAPSSEAAPPAPDKPEQGFTWEE